jgi:hypothetical protein
VPETPTSALSFAFQPEGIDDKIKENVRDALHLPPYHLDLNPIELDCGDKK